MMTLLNKMPNFYSIKLMTRGGGKISQNGGDVICGWPQANLSQNVTGNLRFPQIALQNYNFKYLNSAQNFYFFLKKSSRLSAKPISKSYIPPWLFRIFFQNQSSKLSYLGSGGPIQAANEILPVSCRLWNFHKDLKFSARRYLKS